MSPQSVFGAILDQFSEPEFCGRWKHGRPETRLAIAGAAKLWRETDNPFFVDVAHELAIRSGAPIEGSLADEILRAMEVRRLGTAKGTWKQVRRHYAKGHAFVLICNLRFRGADIAEAVNRAAAYMDKETRGEFTWTASTLEKEYQRAFVKAGQEKIYHDAWARMNNPAAVEWAAVLRSLPAIPSDRVSRIGTRR